MHNRDGSPNRRSSLIGCPVCRPTTAESGIQYIIQLYF